MKKLIIFLLAILSPGAVTVAQEPDWQNYLTGYDINSLYSQEDYIWVTTDSFLVKLEKSSGITTFLKIPWIPDDNYRYQLRIDSQGKKWLYNGLCFDENSWEKISVPWGEMLMGFDFGIDKNDNLLYSHGRGITLYDGESWTHYNVENTNLPFNGVGAMAEDVEGNLWMANSDFLGYSRRLVRFDETIWTVYQPEDEWRYWFSQIESRFEGSIRILAMDHQNNMNYCLLNFDGTEWTEICVLDSAFTYDAGSICMAAENSEKTWFGSANGLACFDGSGWITMNTGNSMLPSNHVKDISIDDNGLKWVGTDNGLAVFNEPVLFGSSDISNSAEDLQTNSDDNLHINHSLKIFPNPATQYIQFTIPPDTRISCIEIYSVDGKLVRMPENSGNRKIDINDLQGGIYLLWIETDKGHMINKFIRQ